MENKTKICCLDVDKSIIDFLSIDFDVFDGSLGKKVQTNNESSARKYSKQLLLNYDLPDNLHEYDVLIDEMEKPTKIPYNATEHTRENIIGEKAYYFISNYPETVFNPIPCACSLINDKLREKKDKPILKILFQSEYCKIQYNVRNIADDYDRNTFNHSNYSHTIDFISKQLVGTKVKLCDNKISKTIFQSFLDKISYCQTYFIPKKRNNTGNEQIDDDRFLPLLFNQNGDVISYAWLAKDDITFMFPQMENNVKVEFLKNFFNEVLYRIFSEYFPTIEANAWTKNREYYLPKHENLLLQKEENRKSFEKKDKQLEEQISDNNKRYNFLHTILSGTGDELVNALIIYLKWLGFENSIAKDATSENGLLEEDIQIDLGEKGLVIIESKGIGGTSTDAQCSQIDKIKHRRCKERGSFDVFSLYIVNNERYKVPLSRTIPPFTKEQIKDAVNNERGVVTTWQLFNLYFNIENGFITKKTAREKLLSYGLIDFMPDFVELGQPTNYYKNNIVVCIDLNNTEIQIGDYFVYEKNGKYYKRKIIDIQQGNQSKNNVSNGDCGFKLEETIPKVKRMYLLKK